VAQDGFETLGQLVVPNGAQRIRDNVELDGRDCEMQSIGVDVELGISVRSGFLFGWHDGRTIAPADARKVEAWSACGR
jgi:hypothetical protein